MDWHQVSNWKKEVDEATLTAVCEEHQVQLCLTASAFDHLLRTGSEPEQKQQLTYAKVFAGISPWHKSEVVKVYQ